MSQIIRKVATSIPYIRIKVFASGHISMWKGIAGMRGLKPGQQPFPATGPHHYSALKDIQEWAVS